MKGLDRVMNKRCLIIAIMKLWLVKTKLITLSKVGLVSQVIRYENNTGGS